MKGGALREGANDRGGLFERYDIVETAISYGMRVNGS